MISPDNVPDLSALDLYSQKISQLTEKMQRLEAVTGSLDLVGKGNFEEAGKKLSSLRNPVFRLNNTLVQAEKNFKSLGVSAEDVMTRASYRADMLARRFETIQNKITSIPGAFKNKMMQGIEVEAERINASSGIMRSGYSDSINESQRIITEVRSDVTRDSAPLPGSLETHLAVLSGTIDDSMKMAKDAGKSIQEAQAFSAKVASTIGAIGGSQNAQSDQTLRFANALMSGSLSGNDQMDLVERNPAVMSAIKTTMKEYGVTQLKDLSVGKRQEAVTKILDKSMPKTQLDASSSSLGGRVEGLKSAIQSFTDFNRSVKPFDDYTGGLDITVFEELKHTLFLIIDPLTSLTNAIIKNPLIDPMTNLVKALSLIPGYFGATATKAEEYKDMDSDSADKLGFLDYLKYLNVNSENLFQQLVSGDSEGVKQKTFGVNTTSLGIGSDVSSKVINNVLTKFKSSIDNFSIMAKEKITKTPILNGMNIGESMGTIVAQFSNGVLYLFNNLLPILIDQTISFFRGFKDKVDKVALLQFTQSLGVIKGLWETLKEKFATASDTLPKFFESLQPKFAMFNGLAGTLGTVLILLTGVMAGAATKILQVIHDFGIKAALMLSKEGSGNALHLQQKQTNSIEARERLKTHYALSPEAQKEAIAQGYNLKDDVKTAGDFGFGSFSQEFTETSGKIQVLGNLNPENFLGRAMDFAKTNIFGVKKEQKEVEETDSEGNVTKKFIEEVRENKTQRIAGTMSQINSPLAMAASAGLVPQSVAGTLNVLTMGASVLGNIQSVRGDKGTTKSERAKTQSEEEPKIKELHGNIKDSIMNQDFGGAFGHLQTLQKGNMGTIGKALNFFKPLGSLLSKINPAWITAIAANLPIITGFFGFVVDFFRRVYQSSPKLQEAISRFMTGLMNMFNKIKVTLEPLYNRFIRPVFKAIGDVLAIVFNKLMDFLNLFTGNAFGKEGGTVEDAKQTSTDILEVRTFEDNQAIEQGKKDAIANGTGTAARGSGGGVSPLKLTEQEAPIKNAAGGFVPLRMGRGILNAAGGFVPNGNGFGSVTVPKLVQAASLEQKLMPANSSLIMANSSETILNRQQMESGILMQKSATNVTIPSINIVINATANQNEQELANKVVNTIVGYINEADNLGNA